MNLYRLLFKKPLKLKPDIQYAVRVQQYCGSVVHGESEAAQYQVIGRDSIIFTAFPNIAAYFPDMFLLGHT